MSPIQRDLAEIAEAVGLAHNYPVSVVVEGDGAAVFSRCGRYRYSLTRAWGTAPPATFVMLNPSTADATKDDPTIRRCRGFARDWGCGGLVVVNLYAYRATKPADMLAAADPVGPLNDVTLRAAAEEAWIRNAPLVVAWGANARPERAAAASGLIGQFGPDALGVTKAGQPRHPLYLPAAAPRTPWVLA